MDDLEFRWKLGRANKGSPEVPRRMQYRVLKKHMVSEATYGATPGPMHAEWSWSEWRDIPICK